MERIYYKSSRGISFKVATKVLQNWTIVFGVQ